jgi:hypothetical protein
MKKLKCQKCEYIWNYKGNARFYATCPCCLSKVNIKNQEVKDGENIIEY